MRRAAKVDSNHGEIVAALRKAGWLVLSLAALGKGVPDLLCYQPRTQRFTLVEVKRPKGGKLTPLQLAFRKRWPFYVIQTVEQAIELGRF